MDTPDPGSCLHDRGSIIERSRAEYGEYRRHRLISKMTNILKVGFFLYCLKKVKFISISYINKYQLFKFAKKNFKNFHLYLDDTECNNFKTRIAHSIVLK